MTASDLQGNAPNAGLFSYSYAAVDKTSTDSASRGPSAIAEHLVGIRCTTEDRYFVLDGS